MWMKARIEKVDCFNEVTFIEEHCFYFFQTMMVCLAELLAFINELVIQITCLFRLFFCEGHQNARLQPFTCMPCPVDEVNGTVTFRTLQNYIWQQQRLCLCSYACNLLSTSQAQELKSQRRWELNWS